MEVLQNRPMMVFLQSKGENFMKIKRFWLGMLVIVLVFGMTVEGCEEENEPEDVLSMGPLPGTVTITGNPYVGQTLTANTDNLGGSGTISYEWRRGFSTIATGKTYGLTNEDLDKKIFVYVTRPSHTLGNSSNEIGPITSGPPLTGTVSITGVAKVGQTLTVNTGSLGGSGTISYQWKRGNSAGAVNTDITDATGSSYILSAEDFGKYVSVSVTRSGYGSNVSSTALGPVVDAMVWSQVSNSIFGTGNVNGVAHNGTNQWVAVGDNGILAYSANGESWTKVDLGSIFTNGTTKQNIYGVAYGNSKWIAVGGNGKMVSSTNGTNWTEISGSPFGTSIISSVVYANNRWVAGNSGGSIKTSTDGVSWTNAVLPSGTYAINSIAYGNNLWVAVGRSGTLLTSNNGQNWTAVNVTSIFTGSSTVHIQTVAYANNQWVAAGGGGIIATSTNGQNWTAVTGNPFSTLTIQTVAYGNNKWVAVGGAVLGLLPSRIAVSSDGRNWSSVANTTFGDDRINCIAFSNNKWVAVGDSSKIAYANDN
jgi:photosystem II stability/assembly factor-like uncharacterized protein